MSSYKIIHFVTVVKYNANCNNLQRSTVGYRLRNIIIIDVLLLEDKLTN
jgi:hypothetical protein